jgi:hypothetical protein
VLVINQVYYALYLLSDYSLLLFSSHSALLLLLSSVSPHLGSLLKLLNQLLLLDCLVEQLLLPLIIDLALSELPGFLLHAVFLLARLLLQVEVLQPHVLIVHKLALLPLLQALGIVLGLVATQVILDGPRLLKGQLVEAEFKVYQVRVDPRRLHPLVSATLVHLAVSQVEADQRLVSLHALDEEEELRDGRLLGVWLEGRIFILENIIAF